MVGRYLLNSAALGNDERQFGVAGEADIGGNIDILIRDYAVEFNI